MVNERGVPGEPHLPVTYNMLASPSSRVTSSGKSLVFLPAANAFRLQADHILHQGMYMWPTFSPCQSKNVASMCGSNVHSAIWDL